MNKRMRQGLASMLVAMASAGTAAAQDVGDGPWGGESGTFLDSRDGHRYGWISVAGQIWMAENLDFETDEGWWYYENDAGQSGSGTGRLYTWETARTACPQGWHLPSEQEWRDLVSQVGGEEQAGNWFKAQDGFNAPLGGLRRYEGSGSFVRLGEEGHFWTSTPHFDDHAKYLVFYRDRSLAQFFGYHRDAGNSVRCVRDGG
jgi:uncharacterized protein (TIGR02145 family)